VAGLLAAVAASLLIGTVVSLNFAALAMHQATRALDNANRADAKAAEAQENARQAEIQKAQAETNATDAHNQAVRAREEQERADANFRRFGKDHANGHPIRRQRLEL
jgi:uncharacterized protein YlxW (UPF0749 family)